MSASYKLTRIPSLKTANAFQQHVESLGLDIPCEDEIAREDSPIGQSLQGLEINGKIIGNRVAVHPMEGWDGTTEGGVTDPMRRRWQRFGESGAKLICGGEAMAIRPDGRANPNQLIINRTNQSGLAELRDVLLNAHQEKFGATEDLVIGFQLTHSGRFCRPKGKFNYEPKIAYRHPILDGKFGVLSDENVFSDEEVEILIADFVKAARIAVEVGADFVDIKHCHGYLLHEFLGAYTRPGRYGGSFENRTRILREIVEGIRADGNDIDLAVRLSTFDMVPFQPDPDKSQPNKLGPGIPEEHETPFPYQFGV
ncbi:MAG: NADH:flavin oxidoreductase, partial [Verrucomicrobiota bacterium]|nr:NADH:flavin oxidoreductase [Verrucomicrobiota bacterium]MEE2813508.1 NADH:flavin oxidoreductase [Verrucomicrobiota bacterium]